MSKKSTSIDETLYLLNKIFRYHGLFAVGKLEIIQENEARTDTLKQ